MAKKRLLKILGIVLGSLLALLVVLYLARRPLFESTIASRVQSVLAPMLSADIEISSIGGNWITELTVEGVDIRGKPGSAYEEVLGLELAVQLSLYDLIKGDMSGLHLAEIKAKRVALDLDGIWYSGSVAEPKQDDSPGSWRDLLTMLEQGAFIDVEELVLTPDYVEPGPCTVQLQPGTHLREVLVTSGMTTVRGQIDQQGQYAVDVSGDQSGRLLRTLNLLGQTTNPGMLVAKFSGRTSPPQVSLGLDFDANLRDGTTIGTHCILEYRDGRLIAPTLDVDLPGVSVLGSNLDIPIAQLTNRDLREILKDEGVGRLTAKITDLDPYRALLPDRVLELMPLSGSLSLDVNKGAVQVQPSLLYAKGVELRLVNGSFSLLDLGNFSVEQLRTAKAAGLEFKLTAHDPMSIDLGSIGNLSWAGTLDAIVSGTIFDPSIDATLHLHDVSFAEYHTTRLECGVGYREGNFEIAGLIITEAKRDGQLLVSSITGSASIHLPIVEGDAAVIDTLDMIVERPDIAGRIELDSLRLGGTANQREIAVAGRIDVSKIDPLLFRPGLRDDIPKPPFEIQLRANAIGNMLDVELLKLSWGAEDNKFLSIDAQGPVPIQWAPGSSPMPRQVAEPFKAEIRIIDTEPVPGQPRVELLATLLVDADEFRIDRLEATADNGQLRGDKLLFGLSPIELFNGEASLSTARLGGKLTVNNYLIGNVLSKLLVDVDAVGHLTGEVLLSGTLGRPSIVGKLNVKAGSLKRAGLPGMDDIWIDATFAENQITLLCRAEVAGQTPVEISAEMHSGENTLWEADPNGSAQFSALPLQALPIQWANVADLSGTISGNLAIEGTWDDLKPTLSVDLINASYKAPSAPRIEHLNATIVADATQCTLTGTGDLGAAPATVTGTWIAGEGTLVESFLAGTIDATIQGSDVLLARSGGLKIRGDVDLTAKGGLDKIEVRGTVGITNSKYIKRLSLVPDLKMKGGAATSTLFGPWAIPGGERFDFDIRLESIEPIGVATNVLDTELDLACNLIGQGNNLHIEGACVSRIGKLRLPGMAMDLQSVRLVFPKAHPTRPDIFATASGQRHGIRIRLQASGPWDEPVVTLSSTPPLQPKVLWALATTGVRPNTLANNNAQANTAILATYVLQEIILTYFASESTEASESFVSRFTFEFGSEISRDGDETWQVDFDVGDLWVMPPNFGMRVERDVYEDLNMGLVYRWRF